MNNTQGFTDTHAHIYLEQFKADLADVMARCAEQQVNSIYLPNIDHTSIDDMLEVEHRYGNTCYAMMGLHPCSVKKDFEKELYIVEDWLKRRPFVGVGEAGIDLYWDKTFFEQQQEALKIQANFAKQYGVPLILHCRESFEETISIIEAMNDESLFGIFHCFTGTAQDAKRVTDCGFYVGLGGVATFKNSGMAEVIPQLSLEHIVLETDSPYLAPVPHRGKRNEPAYVPLVAQRVASLLNTTVEAVAAATTDNAKRLFEKKAAV